MDRLSAEIVEELDDRRLSDLVVAGEAADAA